jgi:hypothetical protein
VAKFIRIPKRVMTAAGDLAHADPGAFSRISEIQFGNTIDLLEPKSPALELIAARPRPQRVHFHSIIGEAFGDGRNSTDGVVPYWSAHVDIVDSEVLVSGSHMTIHHQPRSIMEVRRILLEHLNELPHDGVIPIPTTVPANENASPQPVLQSEGAIPIPIPTTDR